MNFRYAILAVAIVSIVTIGRTARAETVAETLFDFDSSELRDTALPKLEMVADYWQDHPDATIVLGGHADPRGTEAYNVGLAARRAEAVREALVELGVADDKIVRAMYGEASARRGDYQADRRVTISITELPLYMIVDGRLGPATALVWADPVTLAELEGPGRATIVRR